MKLIPEKYHQLVFETVEQARDGIFWLDKKGVIHMANRAACNSLNYSRSEILKMKITDIGFSPPSLHYENVWQKTKSKNVYQFEVMHKRKNHVLYPVEVITYHIRLDAEKEYICAFFRDISDKKETETKLIKALKELKDLKGKLEEENAYLRDEIKFNHEFADIIGQSNEIKNVLNKATQVAKSQTTVLITGETGTGKELIARAVHNLSDRKNESFIHLNCASLPETLIESELFGYDKGAFTGADSRKIGRFELADGGTIFLDEIAELPISLQSKLLKVLQGNEFERLGSMESTKVDIRVIAATNKNLEARVAEGLFRDDLFFRLNVFPIDVPPLRKRREDIPLLVKYFLTNFSKQFGKKICRISERSLQYLFKYTWPGNIRELKNIIERAVIICTGTELKIDEPIFNKFQHSNNITNLFEMEKQHIKKILDRTAWKVSGKNGAAELLGLKPTTLEARMKKLNIKRPPKVGYLP